MVTITDGQLPWVIGLTASILVVGAWFVVLAAEDIRRRRARKRKGRAIVDEARKVPGAALDDELAQLPTEVDRLHWLAAADGARAATHSPLLVEIYAAQIHARFGDDITKDAPKEWVP